MASIIVRIETGFIGGHPKHLAECRPMEGKVAADRGYIITIDADHCDGHKHMLDVALRRLADLTMEWSLVAEAECIAAKHAT